MSKFANLNKLTVTADSRFKLPLPQIIQAGGCPVLELAPAMECNKPYYNALLKQTVKNTKRNNVDQIQGIQTNILKHQRKDDKELYAEYVITGWERMPGVDGFVEFSKENAAEFLDEIDTWLFDIVRAGATSVSNFIEQGDIDFVFDDDDQEEMVKN